MNTCERIRRLRLSLGLSQEELAHRTGYTDRSSIAKIESGRVDLSQKKLALFAEALGVTPAALTGWDEARRELTLSGLSVSDVAAETGLSDEDVERVMRGEASAASADTIRLVARALSGQEGRVCADLSAEEYAVLLRYRAAEDKLRAAVAALLEA